MVCKECGWNCLECGLECQDVVYCQVQCQQFECWCIYGCVGCQCYCCNYQCICYIWDVVLCLVCYMCLLKYGYCIYGIWDGCQLFDYGVFYVKLFDDLWYLEVYVDGVDDVVEVDECQYEDVLIGYGIVQCCVVFVGDVVLFQCQVVCKDGFFIVGKLCCFFWLICQYEQVCDIEQYCWQFFDQQ